MMLTTLSAVAAVFVGLWLTNTELNITAMIGMTMVSGIVTKVSIFYYSEYQSLSVLLSLVATPTLYFVMRTLFRRQETIPCAS